MKSFQISIELPHCVSTLHRDSKNLIICIDKILDVFKHRLKDVKVIDIKT